MQCRGICGRLLLLRRRRGQYGTTLRRSRAMSGFVGLYPAKKRRRVISVSRRESRSLRAECAGRVAGPVVLIVEMIQCSQTPTTVIILPHEHFFFPFS